MARTEWEMTSNRARKRAARERAAATGERYVVARRNLDEPPAAPTTEVERPYPWVVRVVHDLTHRVPGVPKHADPASIRGEHEARHQARSAQVRARHEAHGAAAKARHHRRRDA